MAFIKNICWNTKCEHWIDQDFYTDNPGSNCSKYRPLVSCNKFEFINRGCDMLNIVSIEARDLPDAWYQCVHAIIDKGYKYKIDRGSFEGQKRLEFDYITVHIKHPGIRPLLPDIPPGLGIPNPVADGYLEEYLPYLMTSVKQPGEIYTYGERLEYQIQRVIDMFKKDGYGTNQACMSISKPSDIDLSDPPCLRSLDCRIKDNKLHFMSYFRCVDAQEKTLYSIDNTIYYDTLKKIHTEFQEGKEIKILSANLDKGEAVWGKITDSSLRKETTVNDYKLRSEDSVGLTKKHWVFTEDFKIKQAGQLNINDNLILLTKTDNLAFTKITDLDLFNIFKDDPKYYIRNLSLGSIKYLCKTPKDSWKDKRVLPLHIVQDINDIPETAVLGIARSKTERSRYLELTESLGYLFGSWLANGWFKEKNLLIAIGIYRKHLMDKLLKHLNSAKIEYTTYEQDSVIICHIGDKMVKDIMINLGFKSGALLKDVPMFVFNSPLEFKKGLFNGWYDGDSGCTSSKNLADQMKIISSLIGINTSLYIDEPRTIYLKKEGRFITSKRNYRVNVIGGYKRNVRNAIYKKRLIAITERPPKEIEVVDFTVKKYNNFCIGCGSIIVHNSWDLWSGYPANLGAIQMLKEYMAQEIGVEDGEIIATSKGLHLYDYIWELAELRTNPK